MTSRDAVELDFLGVAEKEIGSSPAAAAAAAGPRPQQRRPLDRLSSFRGMQSAISRIHPVLVRSVIAASSGAAGRSVPSTPKADQNAAAALPVYAPLVRPSLETHGEVAPLTIFYGGTVAVFDLPPNKVEDILKLAAQGIPKSTGPETPVAAAAPTGQEQLLGNGDFPIRGKRSLERFFEKRKERLTTSASPYSRGK
ncbi:hypothetical protein NL676_038151 [Syzygium grande]|nr:hypothetical protein NL676_038151 [Syzygium grande]